MNNGPDNKEQNQSPSSVSNSSEIKNPSVTNDQKNQKDNLPEKKSNRGKTLFKATLLFLFLGIIAFFYWFHYLRFKEWTDDSYVNGNTIMLMSPQAGIAVAIFADDNDYVEQGQLLVQIDTTTFQLAYEKAKVDLALAARQVKQLQEEVGQRKADVILQRANLARAKEDYESRANIGNVQAVSREELNHTHTNLEIATATLNVSEHQLESAVVALGSTPLEEHPTIENSKVLLREAFVNLHRTQILCPTSGFVAKRNVQVGEWITTTRALMSIIPLYQIWIDANFKETQLGDIRMGQPATITTDIYGSGTVYHGKVDGIGAGAGGVFSLLPPQNASGNWIKIVQRVPVRIYLDKEDLKKNPLLLGLSAYTTINTSHTNGKFLATIPPANPRFETPIFDIRMKEVEDVIKDIVTSNLYSTQFP